jgi:hypothetical protein
MQWVRAAAVLGLLQPGALMLLLLACRCQPGSCLFVDIMLNVMLTLVMCMPLCCGWRTLPPVAWPVLTTPGCACHHCSGRPVKVGVKVTRLWAKTAAMMQLLCQDCYSTVQCMLLYVSCFAYVSLFVNFMLAIVTCVPLCCG